MHLFSNYPRAGSPESTNCTVWEAGLATGAAPTFLDPIKINGRTYVDGGIAANNPVEVCIKEAQRLFPDREIGAIVLAELPILPGYHRRAIHQIDVRRW